MFVETAAAFSLCIVIAGVILLAVRRRAFRRLLHFDPAHDQLYSLKRMGGTPVDVSLVGDTLEFRPLLADVRAVFLPIEVETTLAGQFIDPCVEMTAAAGRSVQYFERGANGRRYLNLDVLLSAGGSRAARVQLRGKHLRWRAAEGVQAFTFSDCLARPERVAVIAPHPDDAEIAAFGVYSTTDAVVVTVTAGDRASRFGGGGFGGLNVPRKQMTAVRVWDSITIPGLGGVPQERAINLAYPDGELESMYAAPSRDFDARKGDGISFQLLRRMNHSDLMPVDQVPCSWRSLVNDLERIFRAVKPATIIIPFPGQDPHADHLYTSAAVAEALRSVGMDDAQILLTIIHNRWSELYPFGPARAAVTLPPLFDATEVECDGLCLVPLSAEQQLAKHLALEAMHDLRGLSASTAVTWRSAWREVRTQVKGVLHGLGLPPTSYLRRAVRPHELFFVVGLERLSRLVQQHTGAK